MAIENNRPIEDLAIECLDKMKPKQIWTFRDWWEKVLLLGTLPHKKTYEYMLWATQKRGKVYDSINKYYILHGLATRLICVGNGEGVYLVDAESLVEVVLDRRVRRCISMFKNGMKQFHQIKESDEINTKHKHIMTAAEGWLGMIQTTALGTFAQLPITAALKQTILKELGIDPKQLPKAKKERKKPT